MQLFQKHNINPLAGCFPLVVQMPILIGIYHAIMRTPQLQEHANFLGLISLQQIRIIFCQLLQVSQRLFNKKLQWLEWIIILKWR